jgi:MFS family permease
MNTSCKALKPAGRGLGSDRLSAPGDFSRPATPLLGRRASFYLLASITVSFLAGSIAPTPLYPLYQAQWSFSSTAVTLVFGVYALAVLGSLLTLGRLSDNLGRRPVLLAATGVQLVAMLLFATAGSLESLLLARVVQGLATGAAIAAVGAGMLDIDKVNGTIANALSPPIGTALGGIVAGLIVQFLPAPAHLVYAVLAIVYVLQALGVAAMPETASPRAGALASLQPQINVPPKVRGVLAATVPVLVATWALAGFYGSLGPTLVRGLLATESPVMSGLTVFILAGSGGATILRMRAHLPRTMMLYGAGSLFAGVALTIASIALASPGVFFLGTAVAGSGFGAGFQGAVRSVMSITDAPDRAGVLSVLFVVCYLAMGIPAIAAGYLVTHNGGIFATAEEFGAVVMALASLSLIATLRESRVAASAASK